MDIIEGIEGFTEDGGEGRTTFGFCFPNADGPGTPACVASLFVPPDPPMLEMLRSLFFIRILILSFKMAKITRL